MKKEWVKLPSRWIDEGGLKRFKWGTPDGSAPLAALMVLIALAHRAEDPHGLGLASYGELGEATGLSRSKISEGLDFLVKESIITRGINAIPASEIVSRTPKARSVYKLSQYSPKGPWAKLPARRLYSGGRIVAFTEFRLRLVTELSNVARLTYEQIVDRTDIDGSKIKAALSALAALELIRVEQHARRGSEYGYSHAYRLTHLDSRNHMGTTGRRDDAYLSFNDAPF
jgi:hypothetical protein